MLTGPLPRSKISETFHRDGARAYLPKEKLGEIVPFLEDIVDPPMVHLLGAPDECIRRIFRRPLGRIVEEVRGEILERFREKDFRTK